MSIRDFGALIAAAASGWVENRATRLSAALAYYSIFSVAPLLVISIAVAGLVFGEAAARGQVANQLRQLAGDGAAQAIQSLVLSTSHKSKSLSATLIGLAVLLFGASGAFGELKDALNTIWGVEIKPGRTLHTLFRERFLSFTMVLSVGFLLLSSLILSAALAAVETSMHNFLPLPAFVLHAADFLVSLVVVSVLFAMVFRILPNVILRWRDVAMGAAFTALLFTIGKFLIGFYLGTSGVASSYGAAGSAIVALLWVYYSACILFFGAELTKACVLKYGPGVIPDRWSTLRAANPKPGQ